MTYSSPAKNNADTITITLATPADADAIWEIFKAVVKTGDSYTYKTDTSRKEAEDIWKRDPRTRYVVRYNNAIAAFYDLKPNQRGLGSHIANAGYMVHPDFQGKGIGKTMGQHSIEEARKKGYKAMQFNMVVSTNEKAVNCWKSIGFSIIGTIPKAFDHKQHGLVDAYIMHRFL
ncbi:MAG: GNAT family N-acetyltransferase [Proteobacteria bacterium]|nr:GNAT family N-acetyltransferase [Pseudomonadota bacterium]